MRSHAASLIALLLLLAAATSTGSWPSGRDASRHDAWNIDVPDPTTVTHEINPLFMGCHLDLGFVRAVTAFYAQMIQGESFELLPPARRSLLVHTTDPAAEADCCDALPQPCKNSWSPSNPQTFCKNDPAPGQCDRPPKPCPPCNSSAAACPGTKPCGAGSSVRSCHYTEYDQYTLLDGADVISPLSLTVSQAKAKCDASPLCAAFAVEVSMGGDGDDDASSSGSGGGGSNCSTTPCRTIFKGFGDW
jgi:hypothetical protein